MPSENVTGQIDCEYADGRKVVVYTLSEQIEQKTLGDNVRENSFSRFVLASMEPVEKQPDGSFRTAIGERIIPQAASKK